MSKGRISFVFREKIGKKRKGVHSKKCIQKVKMVIKI